MMKFHYCIFYGEEGESERERERGSERVLRKPEYLISSELTTLTSE